MSGITTGEGSDSAFRQLPHGQVTWKRIYLSPVSARPFRRDAVIFSCNAAVYAGTANPFSESQACALSTKSSGAPWIPQIAL